MSQGKILLATRVPEEKIDRTVEIIERFEGESEGQGSGRGGEEQRLVEVEEELSISKNKVARGGVRVTTEVSEKPVEKTVTLREEQVEVERKPVDRKLKADEADAAFEERTIEMTETGEELEVGKEARVVEEVTLKKRAEEHEEKVRDTVRRSEVEVERIDAGSKKGR